MKYSQSQSSTQTESTSGWLSGWWGWGGVPQESDTDNPQVLSNNVSEEGKTEGTVMFGQPNWGGHACGVF